MNTVKFLKMDDAQLTKEIEVQSKKIKSAKDTIAVLETFRIAAKAKMEKSHKEDNRNPQTMNLPA